jgi:hypothetical protein
LHIKTTKRKPSNQAKKGEAPMAINLDAIRNKLNQLSGNATKKSNFWKLPEGEEATIRLLSFPNNDGQPFKELYFYYNVGDNRGLLAPFQFGKPDPFQELISKLREDGSKESYELAKKLYPKMRCYAPVVVRGEEDKGVQLWSFGKQLYQAFLGIMLDEDYGDITDPSTGRDVKVTSSKTPGRQWPTTEVLPRGSRTPLSKDQRQAKEWLDNIPDINNVYDLKTYEELEKVINDWLESDGNGGETIRAETTRGGTGRNVTVDEDEDDFGPPKQSKSAPAASSSKKFRSLDDAFSDLEDL